MRSAGEVCPSMFETSTVACHVHPRELGLQPGRVESRPAMRLPWAPNRIEKSSVLTAAHERPSNPD
jgi:hypothetical protein